MRAIVARWPNGTHLDGDDLATVAEVLQRHPDAEGKIGPGVDSIEIRAAKYGTRCFWVNRIDGSSTDFSWLSCLRAPRPIDDFRQAMRWVVTPQTAAAIDQHFGLEDVATCQLTGRPITRRTSHVHHAGKPFAKIVDEFIEFSGVDIETVEYVEVDGVEGTYLSDSENHLAAEFAEFHRCNAELQVLDGRVHLMLPRKR